MKKTLINLILVAASTVIQADEQQQSTAPYDSEGGRWVLEDRLYLNDDRIGDFCKELYAEFEKYNNLNSRGAEHCSDNVFDSFKEFKDPPWSAPEPAKNYKPLLYEIAKLRVHGELYYFTGKHPHYRKERNPEWKVADLYNGWINGRAQLQFWEVISEDSYSQQNQENKVIILRLSFPEDPSVYLCPGYPKRKRPRILGFFPVNYERNGLDSRAHPEYGTLMVRFFQSAGHFGRLFLYNNSVVTLSSGGGDIEIQSSFELRNSIVGQLRSNSNLSCHIKFNFNK